MFEYKITVYCKSYNSNWDYTSKANTIEDAIAETKAWIEFDESEDEIIEVKKII